MKYKDLIFRCNPSQTHAELNDLLLELEKISIKTVLEIGVHLGGSIKVWKEVFNPELLIGLDGDITPEFANIDGVVKVQGYSQQPETVKKIEDVLQGKKIDFLFIDGGHLYNEVKQDFEIYSKMVREGGIIALHDVILKGNDTCEVHRYWPELVAKYNTKTISYKAELGIAATGCGVVYV